MGAEWYYAKGKEKVGPLTTEQLKRLVRSGELARSGMVWKEGMAKWTPAEQMQELFDVASVRAVPASVPPPLPAAENEGVAGVPIGPSASSEEKPRLRPGILTRLLAKLLSDENRELIQDIATTWSGLRLRWRILSLIVLLATLCLAAWVFLFRPAGKEESIWGRVWESGVITGLVSLIFAYLQKKLKGDGPDPKAAAATTSQEEKDSSGGFLDLGQQQWLALLSALFIPTLIASLATSFLIGNQVHYYLTGPILCVLGLAITVLSGCEAAKQRKGFALGVVVGGSAVLLYLLTCINTRWILLLYTVAIILPALELFALARKGTPPIRANRNLLVGFAVIGLALFLGITALPRSAADGADSARLVGTWTKGGKSLIFTKGGTVTVEGGYSEWVAKFTFDGKKLKIYNDQWSKVEYDLDLTSDDEMLLGEDQGGAFGEFSVLKGRWRKGSSSAGTKKEDMGVGGFSKMPPPPPGRKHGDPKAGREASESEAPNLNSPLAAKLVGSWKGVGGKNKEHEVAFTKSGKVELTYADSLRKGRTETILGGYSFKKDALLQLDQAGAFMENGWRIEVEFLKDDEVLLVNQGHPYGGFGPLAGRYKRVK